MFRAGVSEAINTREVFYRNRSMTQQSKRSKLLHCRNLSTGLCNPPASIFFLRSRVENRKFFVYTAGECSGFLPRCIVFETEREILFF